MRPILCALVLAVPLAGFARAEDPPLAGDVAKLQGTWTTMIGPEKNVPLKVEIEKTSLTLRFTNRQGDEITMKGEFKLDEKASPRTIDFIHFKRPNGETAEPNLGIYKFDGETWVVCNGGPGNARPKEFKNSEDGPPRVLEFRRAKAEPKPDK